MTWPPITVPGLGKGDEKAKVIIDPLNVAVTDGKSPGGRIVIAAETTPSGEPKSSFSGGLDA
jgi:hypothetical protein